MTSGLRLLMAAVLLAGVVSAQAQVPSSEQLELLRTMSPEDRNALMEQLGLGGGALGGADVTERGGRSDGDRTGERASLGRAEDERQQRLKDERAFKSDDALIVDIDFKKDKPPRIESAGADRPPISIPGELAPALDPGEKAELERLITLIRSRNPYLLDRNGDLVLPGFPPITLAGLDEGQATHRLGVVPSLQKLDVLVTRLPVKKSGVAGLKPFGYDLFRDSQSTFAPITDVPVPADYIVGAGDQLVVQLFGTQNRSLRLTVGRDGQINFPELGPINVAGRSFDRVVADLEQRVSSRMIGVRASVAMGNTRSIRVFVVGEAARPGTYTVSGLATVTSALYAAGGVKPIGSLRDVQLKRQGAVVRRLDLYDLLLRGDTSDDAKLLPGDVIFIPAIASTVAVDGEVNRPAIYEFRNDESVEDLVRFAGGITSEADPSRVALVRVDESRARVVVDVPLTAAPGRSERVRIGDSIRVLRLRPTLDQGVSIEGHVFRSGNVAWREGMRLTDVLTSIDELRPGADINYVLVRRELPPERKLVAVSADLAAALRDPSSRANIALKPRDRIMVFDGDTERSKVLDPFIDELKRQATIEQPSALVRIDGRIRSSGEYPLELQMRVSDLLRAGGGLSDAAYGASAELTRYTIRNGTRTTQLIEIDLSAVVNGDASADLLLQPFDFLNVREVPEWSEQETVTLSGEVRFPGVYPIQRGETLHSVLDRAGGITSLSFTDGAVFTRNELKEREQQQLDRLMERLQSDLAVTSLQAVAANQGQAAQALSVGQSLITQLKATRAVGRLVIDVDRVIKSPRGSADDVALRDGDRLIIPKQTQEITVIGEVQNATSHFYRANLSRDDYIDLSGGTTRKADRRRIYVVRADGSVISSENSGWFRSSAQAAMKPGDTVVVPLDTERMPALPLWQAVTQIVYNLAIAAAAVQSF